VLVCSSFIKGLWQIGPSFFWRGSYWIYAPFMGSEWRNWSKLIVRVLVEFTAKLTGRLIAVSWDLASRGFYVWPNCAASLRVPSTEFSTVAVPQNGVRLLCVGRVEFRQKAQDRLAILVEELNAGGLSWQLHFVGEGPDMPALKALCDRLAWCRFSEWVDGAVELYSAESSCLVIPSRYEGLPLVALEAARCELPIVATHEAGLNSVLPPTQLFSLDDPHSLKRAVIAAVSRGAGSGSRMNRAYSGSVLNKQLMSWVAEARQ